MGFNLKILKTAPGVFVVQTPGLYHVTRVSFVAWNDNFMVTFVCENVVS